MSFKTVILSGENKKYTFKTAGATELGPLDENSATLVDNGLPSSVLEGLSFANGDLHPATKSIHLATITWPHKLFFSFLAIQGGLSFYLQVGSGFTFLN